MAEQNQNQQPKVMTQGERIKARLERLRKNQTRPGLRVEPRDADMRRLLRHPHAGRFHETGSSEWPDDRFTRRRVADGSVKLVEGQERQGQRERHAKTAQHQAQPAQPPRQQ